MLFMVSLLGALELHYSRPKRGLSIYKKPPAKAGGKFANLDFSAD
jgi:hypothetical protein